jgi:hypothetical protein
VTTQRENLLNTAKLASANYADAKRVLAEAQSAHRLGLNVALMDAVSREHVSYHAWRRAMSALASS